MLPQVPRRTNSQNCVPFRECRAKTCPDGSPGTFVFDHCRYAGYVAEELLVLLPEALRRLFPDDSPFFVSLHDIGKVSPGFQGKYFMSLLLEKAPAFAKGCYATDHASIGAKALLRLFGMAPDHPLVRAVAAHHGLAPSRLEFTQDGSWQEERRALVAALAADFGATPESSMAEDADVELLTGLTCVSDWIASDESFFPPDEDSLPSAEGRARARKAVLECGFSRPRFRCGLSFRDIFGVDPYTAQQSFLDAVSEPGVYVLEAPMGMGKTESALYAAYRLIEAGFHSGLYFALPTRLTSDRIHVRVRQFLEAASPDSNAVKLAHGQAWLKEFETGSEGSDCSADKCPPPWFNPSKRGLLFPFAVGTIDQALLSVLNVKHSFVRSFGLAGKVVVLDEVHSYDAYTGTLLDELVSRLRELGCTVIILSATLTAARRAALIGPSAPASNAYPLLVGVRSGSGETILRELAPPPSKTVRLRWIDSSAESPFSTAIAKAREGCNVLCIANTVPTAQEWYRAIKSELRAESGFPVGLIHSRFTGADRERIENVWMSRLGKSSVERPGGSILVATQIVEQSVDIDADWMLSELAPADMLLQRLGRLWRHERKERPVDAPELAVVCARIPESIAEMSPGKKAMSGFFGLGCWVYAPYVLLRSFETLRGRETIRVPDDIRELLESVYSDVVPDSALHRALFADMQRRKEELRQLARMAQGDALPTREDDEESAGTRYDSRPTVSLLVLRDIDAAAGSEEATARLLDGSTVVVSRLHRDLAVTRELYRNLVRVSPNDAIRAEQPQVDILARHFFTTEMPRICLCDPETGVLRLCGSGTEAGYLYKSDFGAVRIKPNDDTAEPGDIRN